MEIQMIKKYNFVLDSTLGECMDREFYISVLSKF
jgi:hypothetical protein